MGISIIMTKNSKYFLDSQSYNYYNALEKALNTDINSSNIFFKDMLNFLKNVFIESKEYDNLIGKIIENYSNKIFYNFIFFDISDDVYMLKRTIDEDLKEYEYKVNDYINSVTKTSIEEERNKEKDLLYSKVCDYIIDFHIKNYLNNYIYKLNNCIQKIKHFLDYYKKFDTSEKNQDEAIVEVMNMIANIISKIRIDNSIFLNYQNKPNEDKLKALKGFNKLSQRTIVDLDNIQEFLFLEVYNLITLNTSVVKCQTCEKYLFNRKKGTKYCNNKCKNNYPLNPYWTIYRNIYKYSNNIGCDTGEIKKSYEELKKEYQKSNYLPPIEEFKNKLKKELESN